MRQILEEVRLYAVAKEFEAHVEKGRMSLAALCGIYCNGSTGMEQLVWNS